MLDPESIPLFYRKAEPHWLLGVETATWILKGPVGVVGAIRGSMGGRRKKGIGVVIPWAGLLNSRWPMP